MSRTHDLTLARLLGGGWPFPVRPGPATGALGAVSGAAKVRQSIIMVLETEPGERVMRPTFGCGLGRYLMAPNTTATRALIRREVEAALSAWEPRIHISGVAVEPADDPSTVFISVDYVHAADQSRYNLVYPFYLGGAPPR